MEKKLLNAVTRFAILAGRMAGISVKNLFICLLILVALPSLKGAGRYEKSVSFNCKGKKLTGKIIMPATNRNIHAVVWIEGSGPYSPLDSTRREWYEANFTSQLLKQDIGIFYFNKSGTGGSEGKLNRTFNDRIPEIITVRIIPKVSHGFVIKPDLCAGIDENKIVYSTYLHDFYTGWIRSRLSR